MLGAFGPPGSPDAVRIFLEYSRFPHLSRVVRPGGVDRITAEHTLGMLLQGMPAEQVPIYPWFTAAEHVNVFREFMASPDFMKLEQAVQEQLELRYSVLGNLMQLQLPPMLPQGPPGMPGAPGEPGPSSSPSQGAPNAAPPASAPVA